jgi:hypothetical protein
MCIATPFVTEVVTVTQTWPEAGSTVTVAEPLLPGRPPWGSLDPLRLTGNGWGDAAAPPAERSSAPPASAGTARATETVL